MRSKSLHGFFYVILVGVALLSLAPLVTLLFRILFHLDSISLLFEKENIVALIQTLLVSALSLLVALGLSLPLSWLLVRTDLPAKDIFRRVFMFPYMIPPYLFAIAWVMLGVPKIGFLNHWFGFDWLNIYSLGGLVWVFASAYFPIILSSICGAMESMDPSLEESARVCGASPFYTLFKITFPCLLPTIASAGLLFLLAVMAAFGIPAIIGNPARIYVLTTKIYTYAKLGGLSGTDQAFMVSLWLFLLTFIFVGGNEGLRRRYSSRLVAGKVSRQSWVRLGKMRVLVFIGVFFLSVILVVLPLLAVVLSSFLRVAGNLQWTNFTLRNYQYLFFEMPEFIRAVVNSLGLGFVTGTLCVVIAFFIAYYSDRSRLKLKSVLQMIATYPFAVPGAVIALAMIVSFGSGWGYYQFALLGSPLLLLFAYMSKYLALSVQNLTPAMSNIHMSLDEAANVFGASSWKVIHKILFPILFPVMLDVFVLTALPVISELTMSVLLTGPGLETLGTVLFQLQEYANPLAACALATCMMILLVIILNSIRTISRKLGEM